jgi:hypothetical protein
MMLRQIVVPTENEYVLHLPDEYLGKKVEVIAFEIEEKVHEASADRKRKEEEARDFFNSIRVDMSDFSFNRDEANER